jgi:hypothetical protein
MLLLVGCDPSPAEVPAPDYADFRRHVYPLLLRDCGFSGCHGDPNRAFAVWGPGRTRLPVADESDPPSTFDLPTDDEVWRSYQRTRSAAAHIDGQIDESALLQKPLVGHDHGGVDAWGRNLWTRDDPEWRMVAAWVAGAPIEDPPIEGDP